MSFLPTEEQMKKLREGVIEDIKKNDPELYKRIIKEDLKNQK